MSEIKINGLFTEPLKEIFFILYKSLLTGQVAL